MGIITKIIATFKILNKLSMLLMDDRRIILVAAALLLPGIVFVAFTTAGFLGYLIPESKLCGLPLTSEI
ncbi:MAG: hypothetical protein U9M95_00900, partial [Candidatus Altiarchaeota archaeon]|nr:hypothetical protein [Candidatus Altiarchaeota archaeon]